MGTQGVQTVRALPIEHAFKESSVYRAVHRRVDQVVVRHAKACHAEKKKTDDFRKFHTEGKDADCVAESSDRDSSGKNSE